MWNVIARRVLEDEPLPMLETARLFALLSVALADAGIAGSEGKYHYGFWRPQTAIHAADEDGNPETAADPDWRPLSVGSSPEYPSTLAAYGGAARRILVDVLGDDDSFSFGAEINTGMNGDQRGVSRSFESITDALDESTRSRIYLGNHFSFALEDGRTLGEAIAEWALEGYFRPQN